VSCRHLLKVSTGVFVVAYAIGIVIAWIPWLDQSGLRKQFPVESMEARLPTPTAIARARVIPGPTDERLTTLEWKFIQKNSRYENRAAKLRDLHEDTVQYFI